MKKNLTALVLAGMLFSCNQPSPETVIAKAPVDSLIANWNSSWNNHDSTGVRNLFAADVLLIDNNLIAGNVEEVAAKWIHPNIKVVNNLKTSQLQEWSTNDRAGYTGKYEFEVVVRDSVVAKPNGIFTVNWIKTDDGIWKITTADIHSFDENN